ncbi:aldehyde dehydrogenase family protein [Rhodococcus sp. T2V]|uniref:aldehyde dehydrogenase family protein n=1 Tax=Rhodococcus sp. T2V TaxID=3034164 RepID=UPI0023E26732|nr:aldehyde dehydrogenase family protein [Rhodococcus sp. T2V]MDF3310569.1 aldehyde dehydrogenase family protein [Rhodococcus sp. T2V]
MRHYEQFIDGAWVRPASGQYFEDRSPFDGSVIAEIAAGSRADAAAAVASARRALPVWIGVTPEEKQRYFLEMATVLERRRAEIFELLAQETGMAVRNAVSGFHRGVAELRQAAGWVYMPQGEIIPSNFPGRFNMAVRRPLGVVAGISPWNSAQALAWRTVIAPLAFGNTVVLKPSEESPICAGMILAEVAEEVGLPPGVLNVVSHAKGQAQEIADEFFENDAVRCINFTGSSRVGRMLAERAARHLKRIVVELGGYNPMLVLADADIEYAVDAATFGAFFHQGQICMSTRKVIIEEPLYEDFVSRLVDKAKNLPLGNPLDEKTLIGPLITSEAVASVQHRVNDAVERGARVLVGGGADGSCYRPTVLADVPEDASLYREEAFGPVVVVQSVRDKFEGIRVANDHRYGLTASVFTGDPDVALEIAAQIEAGAVRVNDQTVMDENQMPLGGTKDSGWGRSGPHSIEDFTEWQWVSVQNGRRTYPTS